MRPDDIGIASQSFVRFGAWRGIIESGIVGAFRKRVDSRMRMQALRGHARFCRQPGRGHTAGRGAVAFWGRNFCDKARAMIATGQLRVGGALSVAMRWPSTSLHGIADRLEKLHQEYLV